MAHSSETQGIDAADLIAQGRAALLEGDKTRARSLLGAVVRDDPENVEAWLWLSGAHTDPEEISYCLYHVLLVDPDNEQAHEGLEWVKATYGSEMQASSAPAVAPEPQPDPPSFQSQPQVAPPEAPPPRAAPPEPPPAQPVAMVDQPPVPAVERQPMQGSWLRLLEAALHVGIIGALLGLLRLVGSLRPGTLLLIRGRADAIDAPSALLLSLAAGLSHALALLLAWVVLSRSLARARNDRKGDLFDSLLQAAETLIPGYLAGLALVVAGVGLNWSERRWLPIAGVVWGLLIVSAVWIVRRLARRLDPMRVSRRRRVPRLVRIVIPALLQAVAGLGIAGLAVQALLRML